MEAQTTKTEELTTAQRLEALTPEQETQAMSQAEKLRDLIRTAQGLTEAIGPLVWGIGTQCAQITDQNSGPKVAAGRMRLSVQILRDIADAYAELAKNLDEWDASRIIVSATLPIVNAKGQNPRG